MNITVHDIIIKYLIDNGYEGLGAGDCACDFDNLMSCGRGINIVDYCEPGYKVPCDCGEGVEPCKFHIEQKIKEKQHENF